MRFLLQLTDTHHHGATFLRDGPENFQETAGIHGMPCLDGKGIVAIGDIGHRLHALRPHAVHGCLQGRHFVFRGRGVPKGIDLVNETGHAGALAEKSFHVGELYMAVGVHEARAQDAFIHALLRQAHARADNGAVLLHFHKGVAERLPAQGIYIFCSESFHKVSR